MSPCTHPEKDCSESDYPERETVGMKENNLLSILFCQDVWKQMNAVTMWPHKNITWLFI